MAVEEITRKTLKGYEFVGHLRNPDFVRPKIYKAPQGRKLSLEDEEGSLIFCTSFAAFPEKTVEAFPGSYIPPHLFQKTLEGTTFTSDKTQAMLGTSIGTMENPAYSFTDENISVSILHGAFNEGAIQLARLAKEGFTPTNRALYQQTVAHMIEPALKDTQTLRAPLRIHDDCLASTVSVTGFIADMIEQQNPQVEEGIDLIIDGPATAQGILFLQKFAKVNKIKLNITASFLAFGLTEGERKPGKKARKHANYITLPQELFKTLPPEIQRQYLEFSQEDSDRAVVGDMGTASEGILHDEMREIRQIHGEDLCPWNDERTDPHSPNNPKDAKVLIDEWSSDKSRTNIYFPRGGYISYAYDKAMNPDQFVSANTFMIGASRLWSEKNGYGVAYGVEK